MAKGSPALSVIKRNFDDVVVLDVIGTMTVETGAHGLPDYVRHCIGVGHLGVALNLRDVPLCDTGGIASLLRCLTLADAAGGRLVLVDVQPKVAETLRHLALIREFRTFVEEASALMHLRRAHD